MATQDVPGANPRNADELHAGCWAEHDDGSLIFVKGAEGGRVVYEIFDLAEKPPISYTDAMAEKAFRDLFSFPPVGKSKEKWTWHDKSAFPWDRVMHANRRPRPDFVSVDDQLSAAARVADSLRLRGREVADAHIQHKTWDEVPSKLGAVLDKIGAAMDRLGQRGGSRGATGRKR